STSNVETTEVVELLENLANASDLKEDKEFQQVEGNENSELLEDVKDIQNVDPIEKAKEYVTNIAREMGIQDLNIEVENKGKRLLFKLDSEKAALLIGKHGATLNALQQLTQLVVNNTAKTFISVTLDVENYRDRRQTTLEQLADRMADKAVRTGRKVVLEPMPSYERKVIHNALANRIDIETYSEGTEPNRYLVIEPLK
ncbi:protein jag, partial [Butyricicoccus sp. 1XD8-22]